MTLTTFTGVPKGYCISPEGNWDDDPVWCRLDDPATINVLDGWSTDRGRSGEMDRTKTGTSEASIMDKLGIIDPTNASSPLAGFLDPIKHVGIGLRNPFTDTWHQVYDGFTGDLEVDLDEAKNRFEGTWDAADAFDLYSVLEMVSASMAGGGIGDAAPLGTETNVYFVTQAGTDFHVDDRIKQILDAGGWPAAWRIIFSGNVNLQAAVYANRDQLMTAILDCADAEFPGVANFFIGKQGYAVFHGRLARFNPGDYEANGINVWLAGDEQAAQSDDTGTVAKIAKLSMRRGKSDIINAVQSYPQGIQDVNILQSLVTDPTSIAKYGWRSISYADLFTLKGTTTGLKGFAETKLFSTYYVDNYANPHTRVSMLTFRTPRPNARNAAATWALICGIEIGDVIELFTSHPGGGGFNESFFIEGIRYTAAPLGDADTGYPDITVEVDLSPTALYDTNPFT